jgi:hypothetical protein
MFVGKSWVSTRAVVIAAHTYTAAIQAVPLCAHHPNLVGITGLAP